MNKKQKFAIEYYENHKPGSDLAGVNERVSLLIDKISFLNINKESNVLDIACGYGFFGEGFRNFFGGKIYGVDLSTSSLKYAKKRGIETKLADIDEKWPYKDNFFDVVLSVQTLEHILDPDNFLIEARRVLNKKGYLIITTPNLNFWLNRILFLFGYQPFFTEVSTKDKTFGLNFTRKFTPNREPLGHLRVFSLKALCDMVEHYDFKIVKKIGGEINYFPKFLKPLDKIFSYFPGLATDIILVAQK